jgi:hypothetical protein
VADYDKVIPPGKEGNVKVKIHGTKIHPGHFRKGWTVTTNDPENATVVLHVAGDIRKVFEFSKPLSMTGFVDEDFKLETIITVLLDDPIIITGYHWSQKHRDAMTLENKLGVEIEQILEPPKQEKGRKYRLKLWQKGELGTGHYMSDLVLETDFEAMKEKAVPVRISITPDVEIHPRTIFMGEMRVEEGTSRSFEKTFRVIAARGDSLKVLKVIPDSDDVTVNLKELHEGRAYRGTIMVRPENNVGPYASYVTIMTNYPGYEEVKILIKGTVRSIVSTK